MIEGATASGCRFLHWHVSLRWKVSTSAGEKETVTLTVPPGGTTPCTGEAEKGASFSGKGSRLPSSAVTFQR